MTDISVIILVGKEERHIARCLEKLAALSPRQLFIVESQLGDHTHEVAIETARQLGWIINQESKLRCSPPPLLSTSFSAFFHPWPGLQSKQFNWALDNLPLDGDWVLRLDADEYLTNETIERMKKELGVRGEKLEKEVGVGEESRGEKKVLAYTLELKRKFCGGEIRHATNGIRQMRLFRRGYARYDEGLMDERLIVVGEKELGVRGEVLGREVIADFEGAFYDDSLMPMDEWREKHRDYAKREAAQAIESLKSGVWTDPRKASYYKLPRYLRAFAYFCIRYFLKGGILDGHAGWMWNFWQGFWYRWIVDHEFTKLRK